MNRTSKGKENYKEFGAYVYEGIQNNELSIESYEGVNLVVLEDIDGRQVGVSVDDGALYTINRNDQITKVKPQPKNKKAYVRYDSISRIKAGENKASKRSYIRFPLESNASFMLVNYVARIAVGLLSTDFNERCLSLTWHEAVKAERDVDINHIDGNAENNDISNFEVVTKQMNKVHGRLMAELQHMFPDVYTEHYGRVDKRGFQPIRYINGNKVSCMQIGVFNRKHPSMKITTHINKDGEFKPSFTRDQLLYIVNSFGLVPSKEINEPVKEEIIEAEEKPVQTEPKCEYIHEYKSKALEALKSIGIKVAKSL